MVTRRGTFRNAIRPVQELVERRALYPDRPREDPKSRFPNFGLEYSYGVYYGTLRGIYFLDPPRGLGKESTLKSIRSAT